MHPNGHLAISIIGSAAIFTFFKDVGATIAFFASSFLIDIDHLFDYFISNGFKIIFPRDLLHWSYFVKIKKTILLFHSFELIFALWIIVSFFQLGIIWIAVGLGLTIHIITDQLTNSVSALTYFLTYRFIKGFKGEIIFLDKEN